MTHTNADRMTSYYRDLLDRQLWYVPRGQLKPDEMSAYAYVDLGGTDGCFFRRKRLTSGLFVYHFTTREEVAHLIRNGTHFRPGSGCIAGRVHWARYEHTIPWRPLIQHTPAPVVEEPHATDNGERLRT